MEKQTLYDLGLSKNEVEVYLSLLQLGPSTAIDVAKETRLHRPNIYDALNKLSKKGLVAHFMRETTKYYEVVDPDQLMTLMKLKEGDLLKILPELKMMQLNARPPASISVLEGISGVRRALTDIINNTKKFYALGIPKDHAPTIGEGWIREWHTERIKKKVWFHHIVNEDYYPHRVKLLRSLPYTTIKFLPKEYNSPTMVLIYDKGVVFGLLQPLVTIRILGDDITKCFRNYFMMLDKIALTEIPQASAQKKTNKRAQGSRECF